jgi:hypothetical protein
MHQVSIRNCERRPDRDNSPFVVTYGEADFFQRKSIRSSRFTGHLTNGDPAKQAGFPMGKEHCVSVNLIRLMGMKGGLVIKRSDLCLFTAVRVICRLEQEGFSLTLPDQKVNARMDSRFFRAGQGRVTGTGRFTPCQLQV